MFDHLKREQSARTMEPLPGWFARRRRDRGASSAILARLPAGAVVPDVRPAMPAAADEDRRTVERQPERRHHERRQHEPRHRGRPDRRGFRRPS
jgi:hypothetical protein